MAIHGRTRDYNEALGSLAFFLVQAYLNYLNP